ncbi:hypothetical protein Nepgr_011381 [Nepenthes gracilis]|uniref:Retrovirus-related Pol polyprotein from transposon TNT 1-94 n=1 Tax=Nepenthes gracilis TaxID=150966 RepID=A0AAD3XM97_NEPGR|nr:hypothetical protein Nepgr_011381 [Nepenthes gracilis]
MRITIANTAPDGVVTLEMAKGAVLNEEMRQRSQEMSTSQHFERENVEKDKDEKRRGEEELSVSVGYRADLPLACETNDFINVAEQATDWVVDFRASIHVTSKRELFTTYTPGVSRILKMGNVETSKIIGRSDVSFVTNNGAQLILKDVRHVLDIRINIISAGRLDDACFCSVFCDGGFKLTKGPMVVARGWKTSGLYVLQATTEVEEVNATSSLESSDLWHRRLGHMSERGMGHLAKKSLIPEMDEDRLKICSHCIAGKQKRVSFQGDSSSKRPGGTELVHTDTKDQVCGVFEYFHALVERETGKKLKAVRSDNGGEYIEPFDTYCWSHGIRNQKTLQLNDVAEHINRTLMERVKCLLSDAKLPRSFWAEALKMMTHVEGVAPQPDEKILVRRSSRKRRPSVRLPSSEYVLLADAGESEDFDKAMNDAQKEKWLKAMKEEMASLHENHTFELAKLSKGKKALKNKCVFPLKTSEDTMQPRYKARLVVKGFSQCKGIDFDEIFAPVVKMSSVRVVLGLVAVLDLKIEQLDVWTVFLHGNIQEEIYMEQSEGFKIKGKKGLICRLRKSLYGLKQAPRQ